ncbi:hypothetical protein BESB_029730 [Besnoitia besnoiti]|uniref:Uncharacterized protein n=1 Tax=Besnoitia besnoiti TaxID=94643 RepID=A0A2A9LZC2_BESBE|nr:hypothetical protein BESB_029730 [Besnoitia besnoiti]PFH31099.1 hypothetical protein BESB_029730 [Besnoitia besnoiti]
MEVAVAALLALGGAVGAAAVEAVSSFKGRPPSPPLEDNEEEGGGALDSQGSHAGSPEGPGGGEPGGWPRCGRAGGSARAGPSLSSDIEGSSKESVNENSEYGLSSQICLSTRHRGSPLPKNAACGTLTSRLPRGTTGEPSFDYLLQQSKCLENRVPNVNITEGRHARGSAPEAWRHRRSPTSLGHYYGSGAGLPRRPGFLPRGPAMEPHRRQRSRPRMLRGPPRRRRGQ